MKTDDNDERERDISIERREETQNTKSDHRCRLWLWLSLKHITVRRRGASRDHSFQSN